MIYLRAGLFAEGSSDYDFLCRLIPRCLEAVAAPMFKGACEIGETAPIDAPWGQAEGRRADRIRAAVDDNLGLFEILVIHADGSGDPEAARANCVAPGAAEAQAASRAYPIFAAACVPVREVEAWLLVDPRPFREVLGSGPALELPRDPEKVPDPKATLRDLLKQGGYRREPAALFPLFGEQVSLTALRTLPAFKRFEADLTIAVRSAAEAQGHRG